MSARVHVWKTSLGSGFTSHMLLFCPFGIQKQKSEMTGCKGAFFQEKMNY